MAGHSQFKNIMHRKGAQDRKKAKIFNKIAREITVAAKTGAPDPDMNPRLRAAIAAARAANMTNDRIKRAIALGTGEGGEAANYDEIRYEGYAAGGVAVIVEALTDNRNRTAGDVRLAFSQNGGSLGETNSVSFMFSHVGQIVYPTSVAEPDKMFEAAVEAGAENVDSGEDTHEITTVLEDLASVRDALEKVFGPAQSSGFIWKPVTTTPVSADQAKDLLDLIEQLEDNDDVQNVFTNMEMDESVMEKLLA